MNARERKVGNEGMDRFFVNKLPSFVRLYIYRTHLQLSFIII